MLGSSGWNIRASPSAVPAKLDPPLNRAATPSARGGPPLPILYVHVNV